MSENSKSSAADEDPLFYRLVDTLLLAEDLEKAAEVLSSGDRKQHGRQSRVESGVEPITETYEAPASAMSEQPNANKESHYHKGDMGFIPKEGQHIPTFLERSKVKAGLGSAKSSRSRTHYRQSVLMNSKGVQTDNRKELLADQLLNHIEHYSPEDLISQFQLFHQHNSIFKKFLYANVFPFFRALFREQVLARNLFRLLTNDTYTFIASNSISPLR